MNSGLSGFNKTQLLLCFLIAANLFLVIYSLFTGSHLIYDDIEHLRAAFFISSGDVPYRDFFEHHHPLMWYLWAPFISVMPHDTIFTIMTARVVSFIFSLLAGWFLYLSVKRYLGGKTVALLFVCLFFWGITAWSALYYVKPDTYMRTCFFAGLYYLLRYFEDSRYKYLQVSSLLFLLSFLFLQSIVLQILPLVFPVIYFIYRHPEKLKDFCLAAVIPLIIIAVIVCCFFHLDIWEIYWRDNWSFNAKLSAVLHFYSSSKSDISLLLYADILLLSLYASFFYLKNKQMNIYTATIGLLLVFDFMQRLYYPSYARYCVFLVVYAALFCAPFVSELIKNNKIFMTAFVVWSVFHIVAGVYSKEEEIYDNTWSYIRKTDSENKKSLYMFSGIYSPRLSYYWMYPSVEFLHDALYNPVADYDVNEMVKDGKIDIIVVDADCDIDEKSVTELANKFPDIPQLKDKAEKHTLRYEKLADYEQVSEDIWIKKKN
ncbi:MAG: glycosyltransferase family 39 protein [Alphaproteobacteria bacterium]|nr:glycosyltransferase family 39 protein [Alphaproteobacteria bacterium]